jgi:glycosyltransferase involved in cell wall biosynthesis
MRCPSLADLPAPPAGRTGWPWTEESVHSAERTLTGDFLPRVTIVTPSFNQGQFLEETIRSILLQGYSDLEYFVLDGGSTDDSIKILKKYSAWISFWVSEPDGGQSAAINRGLRLGSGVYATWINSDDMLCKNALANHTWIEGFDTEVIYIGDCVEIDQKGNNLSIHRGRVQCFEDLVRIPSIWRSGGYITQPEVLFPLQLTLDVGGLDEGNHFTMDYQLWGNLFLSGAMVHYTGIPFGIFRRHEEQKTQSCIAQTESMVSVAKALVDRADCLSAEIKHEILAELDAYWVGYPMQAWNTSGRLAKFGLPPSIVKPLRNLKSVVEKSINKFVG